MADSEMKRGLAQVMYRFGPESLFDYGRRGLSMKVSRWETDKVGSLDANYVAEQIATHASSFRNDDEDPWVDLTVDDVDFRRPNRVVGSLYPLTMYCQNRSCHRVVSKKEPSHFVYTNGECPECGGELRQLAFVLVHDCGNMMSINPQPCSDPNHGYDHIYLNKQNINDPLSWYFYCGECGDFCGNMSKRCTKCNKERVYFRPIASNSVYYSQGDVLVNLPIDQRYSDDIEYGESWARVLMAAHLGDLDDIVEKEGKTYEELGRMTTDERDAKRREKQIEELKEKVGAEQVERMIESGVDLGDVFDVAEDTIKGTTREEVVEENRERVNLPSQRGGDSDVDQAYSTLSHELFTYLRSTQGYEGNLDATDGMKRQPTPLSLDGLLEQEDFLESNPEAEVYPEKLQKVNIASAWVVDNLPLLNYTFGFTRDRPERSRTDLQPFPHPRGEDSTPVYVDQTPSEAIVLQVDRAAIIEWLDEKGSLRGVERPDTDDESDLKEWFLENVDTNELRDHYSPIEDDLTREVYTLIHSMSHALMRTASGQCGLDSNSISEYVMPSIPAIFLYASSTEHFSLGGMHTLFKTRIHPWVDETIADVQKCVYDPVCEHEDGACHACLHMSEVACESANGNLDRRYLVGSDRERIPAFWESEYV
jgi:hypothetical protein